MTSRKIARYHHEVFKEYKLPKRALEERRFLEASGKRISTKQASRTGSVWRLLSPFESMLHDNGVGNPEKKFIHPDGREAVFDGDTLQLVTDPKFMGTYNYVNPGALPDRWYDIGGWMSYFGRGLGHFALDMVPYYAGGNVRGPD